MELLFCITSDSTGAVDMDDWLSAGRSEASANGFDCHVHLLLLRILSDVWEMTGAKTPKGQTHRQTDLAHVRPYVCTGSPQCAISNTKLASECKQAAWKRTESRRVQHILVQGPDTIKF